MLKQNPNRCKRIELWAKSTKIFGKFGLHFPRATSAKILAACACVCYKVMAQLVPKVEKLSHVIGTAPILKMASIILFCSLNTIILSCSLNTLAQFRSHVGIFAFISVVVVVVVVFLLFYIFVLLFCFSSFFCLTRFLVVGFFFRRLNSNFFRALPVGAFTGLPRLLVL